MAPYRAPLLDLLPYQTIGAAWLAARAQAMLCDEQGLGKTAAAIRACDLIGAQNILVLTPASVRINWLREFERFSPLDRPIQVLLPGGEKPRNHGVVVASYDHAVAYKHLLEAVNWDVLLCDEFHLLKSRTAKRTKAVYGLGKKIVGIAANCKRVYRLSGTPCPNNFSEFFTSMRSMGLATESYYDFVFRFTTGFDSAYGYTITGSRNVDELKARLAPHMLRRTKAEVLPDLPPLFFQTITVPRSDAALAPEFIPLIPQLAQADAQLEAALSSTDSDSQINLLERTASSVTTLRRYILFCKISAIAEQLEEDLAVNGLDKIVVFGIHTAGIEWMVERLKAYNPVVVYGATPAAKRQENIDRFQNDSTCRVLVGNITAAGTGINLQNCHEVVFMEQSWSPADNAQAVMRTHRIGQKNPVRARVFSLYNSVDEHVQDTLTRKVKELSKIL